MRTGLLSLAAIALLVGGCGGEVSPTPQEGAAPDTTALEEATATTTLVATTTSPTTTLAPVDCDASSLYWSPEGLREAVLDPAHIEGMALLTMNRQEIEAVACDVAARIESEEVPMDLFEALLVEWTSIADPASLRAGGWDSQIGAYTGVTERQCAEMSVVSTLIVNVDSTVLGNHEREMPGMGYAQYSAVCDG